MHDRDTQILEQRIAGDTLRQIGEQHELTAEGVRLIVRREATAHVSNLITQMWEAQAAGELLTLAVPGDNPADQRNAVTYLDWLLGELPERGVSVAVHYRPAVSAGGLSGVCFALEDLDFPGGNQ